MNEEGELQKRVFIDIIQEYEQWVEKYPIADRAIIRNHVVEALERGFKIVDEAKKDMWNALIDAKKHGDYKPILDAFIRWFGYMSSSKAELPSPEWFGDSL